MKTSTFYDAVDNVLKQCKRNEINIAMDVLIAKARRGRADQTAWEREKQRRQICGVLLGI